MNCWSTRNGAPAYAEALWSEQGILNGRSTQGSTHACAEAVWLEQETLNGQGTQELIHMLKHFASAIGCLGFLGYRGFAVFCRFPGSWKLGLYFILTYLIRHMSFSTNFIELTLECPY